MGFLDVQCCWCWLGNEWAEVKTGSGPSERVRELDGVDFTSCAPFDVCQALCPFAACLSEFHCSQMFIVSSFSFPISSLFSPPWSRIGSKWLWFYWPFTYWHGWFLLIRFSHLLTFWNLLIRLWEFLNFTFHCGFPLNSAYKNRCINMIWSKLSLLCLFGLLGHVKMKVMYAMH